QDTICKHLSLISVFRSVFGPICNFNIVCAADITHDDYKNNTETPYLWDFDDWLFDLLKDNRQSQDMCDPNPCFNGGSCQRRSDTEFECLCKEPYVGRGCQKGANVKCGHGFCMVDMNKPPYYKCKCRPPHTGPDCMSKPNNPCDPNPCQNGARCIFAGTKHLYCACPIGYTGKFCEIPGDCYFRNGETYRGGVSVTVAGEDCLNWNDYFILARVGDPFMRFADFDGLGYNNHCRNPDGDIRPWCFIKKQGNSKQVKVLNYYHVPFFSCCHSCPTVPPSRGSSFSQCGIGKPKRGWRIYGGTKAFPGSNPWQASVQSRDRGSYLPYGHICGGILISSCWVLTAGHCIAQGKQYQVVLGGINILEQEAMDQTIPVTDIYVHPDYREALFSIHNDIALLKLQVTDSPYCAKETPFVKIACLPDEAFPAGTECVISGWGATETQSYSSQLMDTNVFLISQEICKAPHIYASILDDSMFCAGVLQGGIDTCQGDSGGPLMCEKNGTHYVTGVVSWGDGCGKKNKPGVYANVLKFKEWIISKMN
uniref:trypsin n=1 Tax=Neogobius melanostomus TaxID=47308 RepID=A0A8C6SEQ7_9GOBI